MRGSSLTTLAVRNAVASVLERGSGILSAIVLTPILLHSLGRDLYGIMAAATSTFDYLILLRGGLGAAMRRHVTIRVHTGRLEEARRVYQAGFWWGLLLRAPILLAGLLLAEPLCRFVNLPAHLIPDAARGVSLLMVAALFGDVAVIFEVPRYATGDTSPLSILQALGPMVRIALVFAAFHYLAPTLAVYGGLLVLIQAALLVALAALAQRTHTVGPAFPKPGLGDGEIRRELFGYGGLALLAQGAGLLYVTADNLLIGRIYGTAAVAFYSIGARWMPIIRGFLLASVRNLSPLFTQLEASADASRTRTALLRAVALTSALAVPCCLVPCVLGDLFLDAWVGPEYRGAWVFMLVSLAPAALDVAFSPVFAMLIGRGRIGWLATAEMAVAVGNVAISLVLALTLHFGLVGFALGNGIALLVKSTLVTWLVTRREEALPSYGQLLAQILKALAGGAPALLLLYATRAVYGGSLLRVIAAGIAGGLLCLAGSVLAAVRREDLRGLLKTLRAGTGAPNTTAGVR